MTFPESCRHPIRVGMAACVSIVSTLLLVSAPSGAQAQLASRFESPEGWTLLTWRTPLPVAPGGTYRLRATLLNATDRSISLGRLNPCTWNIRADVAVEEVTRTCQSPDDGFLAPEDSATLDITLRALAAASLGAMRLEDRDGELLMADGRDPNATARKGDLAGWVPRRLEMPAKETPENEAASHVVGGVKTRCQGRCVPPGEQVRPRFGMPVNDATD
jgi:hypothetical protein